MRVALLALALLAGCAAPAPAATTALDFAPWSIVDDSVDGSEPMVAVAPDGAIYVSAMPGNSDERPYGLGEVSRLWRSDDDGATWTRLAPHAPFAGDRGAGGGDSAIAISPQGTVFVSDLYGAQMEASSSRDRGATWTRAPIASPMPYLDRQWMAADLEGRGYILARSFFPGIAQWVLRSDDEGATWNVVGRAWTMESDSTLGPITSNVAVHPREGSLHTVFGCSADGRALCLTSSGDIGVTWRHVEIARSPAPAGDIFPSLAIASDGAFHVAWIAGEGGERALWLASSADGRAWRAAERVPATGTFVFPALVAEAGGRVALAWYGAEGEFDSNDVAAARDAAWRVTIAMRGAAGAWSVMNATDDPVHRGSLSTVGISLSAQEAPDWTLGDLLGLALDREGRLVVAFTTGSEGDAPARAAFARQAGGALLSQA